MKRRIYLVIEARDYEIRAAKDCARRNGECIYHIPCGDWYDRSRIDSAKGEWWFCTEVKTSTTG